MAQLAVRIDASQAVVNNSFGQYLMDPRCAWTVPTKPVVLTSQEVHVWLARLDDASFCEECCQCLLSSEEKNRASRFKFAKDRRHYIASHAALRSTLSSYLPVAPEDLQFSTDPNGKPTLTQIPAKLLVQFNLSHSNEIALIAVVRERQIGVDAEWVKQDFPFLEVAQRFFSAKEVAALTALPTQLQRLAFFKCWTGKEAFLKAKGTGLSGELDEVEIVLNPDGGVRVNGTLPNWTLVELIPSDGYVGALVFEGQQCRLKCFQWRHQLTNKLIHRHSEGS